MAHYCLAMCGAQSGKSLAAAPKVVRRIVTDMASGRGRGRYWVVGPTYELLEQAQVYFLDRLVKLGIRHEVSDRVGSVYRRVMLWSSSRVAIVDFKSAERPERLIAVPVDGMWINESATIKEDVWTGKLRSRLIATDGWVVLDTTPMGENWVYNDFYLRGLPEDHPDFRTEAVVDAAPRCSPERRYCTHFWHSADNPSVSQERVELARATLPDWAFRREWLGDPHNYSGMVYPDWDARRHVVAHALMPARTSWRFGIVGTDWGYSEGHAGVMLVVAQAEGAWWVTREEAHYQQPVDPFWLQMGKRIEKDCRPRTFWCDPSGGDGDAAASKQGSLWQLREAVRADVMRAFNGVEDGIRAVATAIKTDQLRVSDRCVGLIREMPNYRWAQAQDGNYKQAPRKVDDDRVDALRYAIASEVHGGDITAG